MEIEYLREFTVIAKMESFSRAAEELCISQSALSKHILALERELDVPLLIRNSRNVTISPAGAQILPLAAQIYELSNKIRVAAEKENSRGRQLLRVASIPVMAQYNITGALARFQRAFPNVTLEVEECEQHDLLDNLRLGRFELAFMRLSTQPESDIDYKAFCSDRLLAVVHRDHPLAAKGKISLRELENEPMLALDERTGLHGVCGDLFRQVGLRQNIVYTGHRPENIAAMVAQGMGIALLMKGHMDYIRSDEVCCLEIEPAAESTICLVRVKDATHSSLAKSFWDMLEPRNG